MRAIALIVVVIAVSGCVGSPSATPGGESRTTLELTPKTIDATLSPLGPVPGLGLNLTGCKGSLAALHLPATIIDAQLPKGFTSQPVTPATSILQVVSGSCAKEAY